MTLTKKGTILIPLCIYAQSLHLLPECDFALLVLLALSVGRMKGSMLGALAGAFRGAFSIRPFGLLVFVLAAIGFLAGVLGERRYALKPWQKVFWIFGLFFLADLLLLFLGEEVAFSAVFPSAILTASTGAILWYFLLSG